MRITKSTKLEKKLLEHPLGEIKRLVDLSGNANDMIGDMLADFLQCAHENNSSKKLREYQQKVGEMLDYVEQRRLRDQKFIDPTMLANYRKSYNGILEISQLEEKLNSSIEKLQQKIRSAREDKTLEEFIKSRTYSGLKGTAKKLMNILEQHNHDIDDYRNEFYELISNTEEEVYSPCIKIRKARIDAQRNLKKVFERDTPYKWYYRNKKREKEQGKVTIRTYFFNHGGNYFELIN